MEDKRLYLGLETDMTQRQEGGSAFSQELVRIRNASGIIRFALERIGDGNSSVQTLAILVTKMAVQLTVIFDALAELDKIGHAAKSDRVIHPKA